MAQVGGPIYEIYRQTHLGMMLLQSLDGKENI